MTCRAVLLVLGALASLVAAQGQGLDALNRSSRSSPAQVQGQQNCTCVPYFQCDRNGTIIYNGAGLFDSGFPSRPAREVRALDGNCKKYQYVCCKAPLTEPLPPPPPPPQAAPQVPPGGCGERHPDGVGLRITGDKDSVSQFGEFPWMVAILREESQGVSPEKMNVYKCGGSLIHPQVVITAAHCVAGDADRLKIRAGEWDTQTKNELFPHQDREVTRVVTHPQYQPEALYNDVALLLLDTPVQLTDNVDVVCLPQQGQVFDRSNCFASGWGKDKFGKEGLYQVTLQKVALPVVLRNYCVAALRNTRLGRYFQLHESFICAGGGVGKNTCRVGIGSPLVCPLASDPSRYQQAGISAWRVGCSDDVPGVFVNVARLRGWLDEQMAASSLNTTSYSTSNTSPKIPTDTAATNDSILLCDPEPTSSKFGTQPDTECGVKRVKRHSDGTPLILFGEEAQPGEFPWHVAVFERRGGIMVNICGGSLISPRLVISAAHCFWASGKVKKRELFQIAAGKIHDSWDLLDADEQRRGISSIKVNCFYQDFAKYYDEDIAAVILQHEFFLSERVYPICIDWEEIYRPTVMQGVVAGWGLNEKYERPETLQKAWLSSVDINVCRKEVPSNFSNFIANRKFCAGYRNGTGVCNGDSGGGLVFPDAERSKWYLWGIVSVGITNKSGGSIKLCSRKDYSLFTNIYKFLPWLRSVYT